MKSYDNIIVLSRNKERVELMRDKIFVTQPLLPDFDDYTAQLKDIWESKWLTNMGTKHNLTVNRNDLDIEFLI